MSKKKFCLIAGICVLAAAAVTAACLLLFRPQPQLKLTLSGDRVITLEHGREFTDPGAQARLYDERHPEKAAEVAVTAEGSVDSSRLGTYRIKYTAVHKGRIATAYRDVKITDMTKPIIELVTNPDSYTLPGQPYKEEGFTATDDIDGDLTALVIAKEADGVVTYTVSDRSGNTATVQRTIVYNDPIAPQLQLVGNNKMTVTAGTQFVDPGCKASDNVDGDLTAKITVSGSVNVYVPGTYKLTYTVKDGWGNESAVTRQVTVKAKAVNPSISVPGGKNIYLTFDDGPGPHTGRLLDILKKYNVKATFFVVNTKYISTVKRIAAEGHSVAVHSATHKFSQIYASESAYFADLQKMQSIIESYTGTKTMLMRFPGGSSNSVSGKYSKGIMSRLTQAVKAQGYRYFDWNVDSNDAGGASSAEQVFNNVVKGIGKKKNSIVLQHDIKGFSVDAVERIIIWGLENGYTFLPLTASSVACEHPVYN